MIGRILLGAAAAIAAAGAAAAQIPPDIQAKLREIGPVIAPADTTRLYAPLFAQGLPQGVTATKDIAFGPDPKLMLSVFSPSARGPARPVFIYAPGGQGVKQLAGPEGAPFYDNIGAWGVANGLVVVTTQYRTGPGVAWDQGARDLGATIAWVKANIARHGGDPARIVILGQSNGATQLATYLGHPELQGSDGPGVRAAVLMSGGFNILPIRLTSPPARFVGAAGPPPPGPGGPPAPPPVDPAEMLRRSNLEGLKATRIPLLLIAAELDPPERVEIINVLGPELRKAGRNPTVTLIPGHSHISEVTSWGTADKTASDPVLHFIHANVR